MASEVPPLRIHKGSHGASPSKLPRVTNRPLSELSPMAIRRNSPSFPQSKTALFGKDDSPAGSSPFSTTSPRLFWQGRDPHSPTRDALAAGAASPSPLSDSPRKRSSIENLKKASRVKNSSMFAIEQSAHYDPSRPTILDGRPQSMHLLRHQSPVRGSDAGRKENVAPAHSSPVRPTAKPQHEEPKAAMSPVMPLSPSRFNSSPAKSSLSKKTGATFVRAGFDPETGIWEDDDDPRSKQLPAGRGLHRHQKSVTFDQAPPQVNEYEMTTPAPSCGSQSRESSYESQEEDDEYGGGMDRFGRSLLSDHDDSFDASLEDAEKTPVVLPEDWRFVSPDGANTDLARYHDDVFNEDAGSPAPTAWPGASPGRPHQTSDGSVDSNGHSRPLPPLPPTDARPAHVRSESLSGAFERMSVAQRSLPTPPVATTISKADIQKMGTSSALSAEDRLRLVALQEQDRERRMRRMGSKETSPVRGTAVADSPSRAGGAVPSPSPAGASTPQLTRASILDGLRGRDSRDSSEEAPESTYARTLSAMDPDVPIPSMEDPTQTRVKEEDFEEPDLYSIPEMYSQRVVSESEASTNQDDDLTSQYSQASLAPLTTSASTDGQETPKAQSPVPTQTPKFMPAEQISLPEFTDFGNQSSLDEELSSYLSPREDKVKVAAVSSPSSAMLPDLAALRQSIQTPYAPETQVKDTRGLDALRFDKSLPGTPDSVVRSPLAKERSTSPLKSESPERESVHDHTDRSVSPSDSGSVIVSGKTSTGPDPTKDDLPSPTGSMSGPEQNVDEAPRRIATTTTTKPRVSSLVQLQIPSEEIGDSLGLGLEKEFDRVVEAQKVEFELSLRQLYYPFHGRFPSSELPDPKDSRPGNLMENIPLLPKPRGARVAPPARSPAPVPAAVTEEDPFANRHGRRQRGYLMRQNTKIVVASERVAHDDEPQSAVVSAPEHEISLPSPVANEVQPSPRKASQPTWTAEPWNGRVRRKSIRVGGEKAVSKRKPIDGPAPPLPGHASNAQESLEAVAEDDIGEEEDWEEGAERGRLFVKVIGVKDLQMPFPQHERSYFALTLDNGLHCVTTAWLDLAQSAPIGQEFELIVLNDLEFQLTLQMKLDEPKVERPQSPTKQPSSPKKPGAFGRLFGSPKKKRELELRAQQDAQSGRRPVTPPSAYELVQGLVAKDGSFARAYVALSEHEKQAYGRPYTVDITCFNEWALEEVPVGSSRSKKSVMALQRRPPYPIGQLELQLLFIPKPKGAKDDDMPKSMNGAVRELRAAEERLQQHANIQSFEGYLSQQGGDCPYWRRRLFKLVGTKLTAFHEHTHQPRATINMAKATRLIDDKSALMQRETSTKGGGRRKSGFAEEEEGYMFVEEGFRIRFANGEVIDFYAESTADKDDWMKALSQVVGSMIPDKSGAIKPWAEAVLKREKKTKADDAATPRPSVGHLRTETYHAGSPVGQANSPIKGKTGREGQHRKTKSLHA